MIDLGILISGRGSNMLSILDAIDGGTLDARVNIVISNKKNAPGLARAAERGIPTLAISHRAYDTREDFDAALVSALRDAGVDWVVLAGFMRIVTPVFLRGFVDRVVNIHPSLLPAFPGVDAQQQALDYGVKVAGCTVHLVNEGVDAGPIIAQAAVPVLPGDDRDALAARILEEEHRLLVETLGLIAAGRVWVEDGGSARRVRIATA